MNFDSFIGNSKIIERLRNKLRQGRFPHAMIFSGPEGAGKHTCARMAAKALNCMTTAPGDFCDACSDCSTIDAGTHPDVVTIGVEEDATQIKIAQVRDILPLLETRPYYSGRSRVFIIDPANQLNQEASNALLKGLEEPHDGNYFVLVSVNVHELLLTVRSRCQVYNFTPLTLDEIRTHGVTDELIVRWSQGSIGRARSLDAAKLKNERELVLGFLETALTAGEEQFQGLLAASLEIGRAKQEFASRMSILAVLAADLLYIKEGAAGRLVNVDVRERLENLAARASSGRLIAVAEFLYFIENSLKNHINRQMLSDMLAITANETVSKHYL